MRLLRDSKGGIRWIVVGATGLLALSPLAVANIAQAGKSNPPGGAGTTGCNDGQIDYSPTSMWPPNHKMQTVNLSYSETDNDGDSISLTVNTITDNQMVGGTEMVGSGQPAAQQGLDWSGIGNSASATDPNPASTTVQVRAERSGTDPAGRIYDINVTCKDTGATSGTTSGEMGPSASMQICDLYVIVPHDQGHATSAPGPSCSTQTTTTPVP